MNNNKTIKSEEVKVNATPKLKQDTTTNIIMGLDLGTSRIKISYMFNEQMHNITFPNRINLNTDLNDGVKVNYNNQTMLIGSYSGYSNITVKKINYDALPQIIFTAAYKVATQLNDFNINFEIRTLLPPPQFKESSKELKNLISSLNNETATVNDKIMTLQISNVLVGYEGVEAIRVFNLNELVGDATEILVIDAGSSTIDIIQLMNIDNVHKIMNAFSYDTAGKAICNRVAHFLNTKYKGASFKADLLERQMKYQYEGKVFDIETASTAYDDIIKEFLAFLKSIIGDINMFTTILTGGSSRLLLANSLFCNEVKYYKTINEHLTIYGNSMGILI